MTYTIEPVLEVVHPHRCVLGEGPVWDSAKGAICWIDIVNGELHEFDPANKTFKTVSVGQMIGCFAFCEDGGLVAGLKNGVAFIDRETGKAEVFNNPEAHLPGNRFNDGKSDPEGRFWVGTMSHTDEPQKGSLYVVEPDQSISKKIGNVSISNGLAWSPDLKIFYYIDTPSTEVVAFDYDQVSGVITNRRIVIKFFEDEGYPDGMTIDNEGMLWIAHWDGWQLSRWDPETGEKLLSVKMPAARVTCCTFGGENLEDLYITTARRDLTPEELEQQPLAGSLFVWKNCGFKGMPAFLCKHKRKSVVDGR